jgi:hypothetical protein
MEWFVCVFVCYNRFKSVVCVCVCVCVWSGALAREFVVGELELFGPHRVFLTASSFIGHRKRRQFVNVVNLDGPHSVSRSLRDPFGTAILLNSIKFY